MNMLKSLTTAIGLAIAMCGSRISAADATFNSVQLEWSASSSQDVTGHKVYFTQSTNEWTHFKPVGNVTRAGVVLPSPGTWFFTVTATNASALESLPSNVVSYTTPKGPNSPGNLKITSAVATQVNVITVSTNLILSP